MEMGDQYGLADLRQMIAGRTSFPGIQQPEEQFNVHQNLTAVGVRNDEHYEMLMLGHGHGHQLGVDHQTLTLGGVMEFCSADDSNTTNSTTNTNITTTTNANPNTTNTTTTGVLEMMEGCCNLNGVVNGGGSCSGGGGGDGGNSRWPRQETLTLLEIRSSLDHKFKEANQKGPLWDEVSRIMAEEHGYQRSGKKCREKFENLYKYYKKTKEGKAGRQDGKNYRFFRQLEALYGETTATNNHPAVSLSADNHQFIDGNINLQVHHQFTNNNISNLKDHHHQNKHSDHSLSLPNSSEFETSSSEDNAKDLTTIAFMESDEKKYKKLKQNNCLIKRDRKNWKAKIRDFVDSRMKKLMEKQEEWLDKMLKTLEHKEQERISREEEWRKQETVRLDQEHKFWAKERAWFEARDAALMDALQRFIGTELKVPSPEQELMVKDLHENNENQNGNQTSQKNTIHSHNRWPEEEISNLMHLRNVMESRFKQNGCSERALWEEISSKMSCLGYDKSAKNCEEKWVNINKCIRKTNIESNRKRKENSRSTFPYFQQLESIYNHNGAFFGHSMDEQGPKTMGIQLNDGPSPSNSNAAGTAVQDSCFQFMMSTTTDQGDNLWENYGVKLNK